MNEREPLLPQLQGKEVSIWYAHGYTATGEIEYVDDESVTLHQGDDRMILIPRSRIRSIEWKKGEHQ